MLINKAFHLETRPSSQVPAGPHNFRLIETPVRPLKEGEILVRHHFLSLDPYMRVRMNEGASYAPPHPLGEVMLGVTVGEVLHSQDPAFKVGEAVIGLGGWQLYHIYHASDLRKIDTTLHIPLQAYLGVLGMPGIAAWYGLYECLQPQAGQTLVVSAATGAVGSVVGQLGRLLGLKTIGIAGGPEKCRLATKAFGFEACLDHQDPHFPEHFAAHVPQGVDLLFENVGGRVFALALHHINLFGRIALCGLISSGYDGRPSPLGDCRVIIEKRLTIQGFIISDHRQTLWPKALATLTPLVRSGALIQKETCAQGLEAAPEAFFNMLKGQHLGKQLVQLFPAA